MEDNPGQLGEDLTDLELVDLEFDIKELEDKIAAVESKRTGHSGESELTVSSLSLAEESAVKEGSGSGSAGVPGQEYPGEGGRVGVSGLSERGLQSAVQL